MVKCPAAECGLCMSSSELPSHLKTCKEWLKIQEQLTSNIVTNASGLWKPSNDGASPLVNVNVTVVNNIHIKQVKKTRQYTMVDLVALRMIVLQNLPRYQKALREGTVGDMMRLEIINDKHLTVLAVVP